ncbi:hypothetical protein J7E49_24840 [Variovorax paradoxus]|nr:hypothetical protein [Variovorax paradoxus]
MCVFMGLMACACPLSAQTPSTARHVVSPAEQAARDNDRVEILSQELKKSEAQLESLARRKAERLAASDMQGANEAEEQRTRALGDIVSLTRELGSMSPFVNPAAVVEPSAARAASSRITSAKGSTPAPWWDVYGKARRSEQLASPSIASAQEVTRGASLRRPDQRP